MRRPRLFALVSVVAVVAITTALLREGPDPRIEVSALQGLTPAARYTSGQMLIGAARDGWGRMVHYRTNADWETTGSRLDTDLKALGFVRRFGLRKNSAEWDREDLVVRAQTHWTRETGGRLTDLMITRPAVPGEIVRF